MREIICAVCGSTDRQVVFANSLAAASADGRLDPESMHYPSGRCARCSLLYPNPIFEPNDVHLRYTESEEDNLATKMGGEERRVRRTTALDNLWARPYLSRHERISDVGRSLGWLVEAPLALDNGLRVAAGVAR